MTAIIAWASVATSAYGATPLPRELGGVRLGAKSEELLEKCKGAGWKCTTKKRKVRGRDVERITVERSNGEFKRMHVVASNGVIIASRAWYRAKSGSRSNDLAKTHGASAADARGRAVWLGDNSSTRMRVSRSGSSIDLVAVDDAQKVDLLGPQQVMGALQAYPMALKIGLIPSLMLDVPSHIYVAQSVPAEIGVQVTNVLKAGTSAATLQYKLYAGTSTTPIAMQSLPVKALAVNGSTRFSIPLGNKLAVGLYRAELSLSGLKKAVAIFVHPAGPDFRVAEVQAPVSANPGEDIIVKARIFNAGQEASTQPWSVTFTLNGQSFVAKSSKKLEIGQADDLGKSEWVSVKATFEPTYVGQNAALKVRVSSPEDIDSSNNQKSKTILSKATPLAVATLEKIPVTMRITSLKCIDGYDDDLGWSDDPALYISGFHSSDSHTWNDQIWTHDDVDEGDDAVTVAVNRPIFPKNDPRRSVMSGETFGFHVSLWDRDVPYDDTDVPKDEIADFFKNREEDPGWQLEWNEIDYADLVFDFAFLKAHQNETVTRMRTLELPAHGYSVDGTRYELTYSLEVGSPSAVTPAPNSTNPAAWVGTYEWTLDGHTGSVTLKANPGSAAFPHGYLSGSWKDGTKSTPIVTREFAGNRWVFSVGASTSYTGFLIGGASDPKSRSIAGTAVTDGNEYGFFLRLP